MVGANCVYVVDDDSSARSGLERLVRTAGHDSRDFSSVAEFLDAIRPDASGCVVLEAGMPGISGEQLRTELESRDLHLPIIVVTAHDDMETRRKAKKMKAVVFFSKPVDGMALLDAINWAMQSNHSVGKRKKT